MTETDQLPNTILKVTFKYLKARERHARLDDEKKAAYAALKAAEAELVEEYAANPKAVRGGVRAGNGMTVSTKLDTQISVTLGNQDAVRKWLVEQTGDDADYCRELVQRKAVMELVREKLDEGVPEEEFPEELKVKRFPIASVRGWKDYYAGLPPKDQPN